MDKPDFSAFGQFIPGFDFLQKLASQAAGGVAPGLQSATAAMPSLGHWVAPTFSVEEIEKRIQDLRAVQFWLDQNGKALGATIQALEVQKMTLSTLENMNVSLKDVAESFKIKPETMQAARPAQAAPKPAEPAAEAQAAEAKPEVDPMQWWGSLTEQFTTIASGALQDMAGQAAKAAEQVAQTVQAGAEQMAQTVQASAEAAEKMAEQAKEEASRAASAVGAASRKRAATAPAKKAGAKSAAAPASASSRARKKPAAD